MEDFKIIKDLLYFAFNVAILTLICLLLYKFGERIDTKVELNIKESALLDLRIESEKKNGKILDKTLEINGIEKD